LLIAQSAVFVLNGLMEMDQGHNAPGWDAIDRALAPLYSDQKPKHYGTLVSYRLGGSDPLQGISAYSRVSPVPHWHFVTYGLSELYEKESDNPAVSGWGFELTFRLAQKPGEIDPPMWALNFLQNLARYVFNTGNVFSECHHMNLNGPICLESDTLIRAICFVLDPELPGIQTQHGSMSFLQIVGITEAEEMAVQSWQAIEVLEVLRSRIPLFVTDVDRSCLTRIEQVERALRQGAAKDGSNTDAIYSDRISFTEDKSFWGKQRHGLTLGVLQVRKLLALLPLRLGFGRSFAILGKDCSVKFVRSEANSIICEEKQLQIALSEKGLNELLAVLRAETGDYTFPSVGSLTIHVVPNQIRDASGKVVQTVG
jgi:hypothetical protein